MGKKPTPAKDKPLDPLPGGPDRFDLPEKPLDPLPPKNEGDDRYDLPRRE